MTGLRTPRWHRSMRAYVTKVACVPPFGGRRRSAGRAIGWPGKASARACSGPRATGADCRRASAPPRVCRLQPRTAALLRAERRSAGIPSSDGRWPCTASSTGWPTTPWSHPQQGRRARACPRPEGRPRAAGNRRIRPPPRGPPPRPQGVRAHLLQASGDLENAAEQYRLAAKAHPQQPRTRIPTTKGRPDQPRGTAIAGRPRPRSGSSTLQHPIRHHLRQTNRRLDQPTHVRYCAAARRTPRIVVHVIRPPNPWLTLTKLGSGASDARPSAASRPP